eukprot:Gregarina_sp_Poly_1__10232@NODE_710_length_6658_cov_139_932484_g537_i0_p2_GENE_NODE_710_length_6658_cov_139_932484_g537_i0NODE_710_length_6658_cov_139_932484_g537_i0_p2_ORF_typecomplete_len351_score101_29DFRP_C/PF16543_5/1_8e04DFRP_C/PF16543_5/1_5e20DFRP_C/PF16543_5/2e03zfCCCH_2/PF14608_6/0_00793H/PF02829_14/0_063H/PF02829_14/5_2e033H/PF02829_14/7_7e03zfCCCH_4/PF18044_1/1_2zfCCCH/PF00642_24/1_6Cytochrome_P460/PF16694_5/40_NODE_710_length_6658_cov_139_932484_g537_i045655617
MPPKKADKGQVKAEEKKKAKIIEDKTFGLKNKNKSKAVQKYIRSVQQQVTGGKMKSETQIAQEEHEKKELKKAQQKQAALLAALTKGTENMKKVADDQKNPQQIKEGQLIDVYVDQRDQKKQENMDDWDQAKLEQVVKTKHGGQKPTTDIVCKFFLDALEKRLYGWFWQCPNGEMCQYKHCLPPGYVLKKKEVDPVEADEDEEPIEEQIERERAELPISSGTPVTLETFLAWKMRKKEAAEKALEEIKREKGRLDMSGRDLFAFNPSLFVDDVAAADSQEYLEDEEYQRERLERESANEREAFKEDSESDESEVVQIVPAKQTVQSISHQNRELFLQSDGDIDLNELDDD